jgi:uncharacterized protein (TIGR02391 family)
MPTRFERFEKIARLTFTHSLHRDVLESYTHPFDARNINPKLQNVARELFDNGHYAQATFEVYKFIDKEIQKHSSIQETGFKLMMQAFGGNPPSISLTKMSNATDEDEQKGFQFLFAGSMLAIRNPRGHEYSIKDDIDLCLDHLGLASLLIRRLEETGYV